MWVFFLGWQGWRVDWDRDSVTIMQSGRVPYQRVVPTTTPSPYPTSTPSPKRVILDVRGTENLLTARLVAVARNDDGYDLELSLSAVDYANGVVVNDEGEQLDEAVWQGQALADFVEVMERYQLSRGNWRDFKPAEDFGSLAWSQEDKIVGLKVGDRLVMVRLDEGGAVTLPTWGDYPPVRYGRSWRVASIEEVPLSLGELEYEKLFFDGGDEALILAVIHKRNQANLDKTRNQGELWKYDLLTKQMEMVSKPEDVLVSSVYPISGSRWLVGWDTTIDGNQPLMVWWREGRQREYGIEEVMDYPGKILVSPGMNYVCYEGGVSGSWWATIVKMSTGRKVYGGPSYSYCRRWLNNRTVVVAEKDYHSSYIGWFTLDVVSGKKTLFDSVR